MSQKQSYAIVPRDGNDAMYAAMSKARDLWPSAHCDNEQEMRMSYAKPRWDAAIEAAPPPPERVLSSDEVECIYHAWVDDAHSSNIDLMRRVEFAVLAKFKESAE